MPVLLPALLLEHLRKPAHVSLVVLQERRFVLDNLILAIVSIGWVVAIGVHVCVLDISFANGSG